MPASDWMKMDPVPLPQYLTLAPHSPPESQPGLCRAALRHLPEPRLLRSAAIPAVPPRVTLPRPSDPYERIAGLQTAVPQNPLSQTALTQTALTETAPLRYHSTRSLCPMHRSRD